MYRIGILEDDIKVGTELGLFLESSGYEAVLVKPEEYFGSTEKELIELLLSKDLTLLLLDIGLPGFDGIRICKTFREASDVPVVMITSDNSELTELLSIQSGADDFVPKPFNTRILLARIEGVIRRVYSPGSIRDVSVVSTEGGSFKLDIS